MAGAGVRRLLAYAYLVLVGGLLVLSVVSFASYVRFHTVPVEGLDPLRPVSVSCAWSGGSVKVIVYRSFVRPWARGVRVVLLDPEGREALARWNLSMAPGQVAELVHSAGGLRCLRVRAFWEGELVVDEVVCRGGGG